MGKSEFTGKRKKPSTHSATEDALQRGAWGEACAEPLLPVATSSLDLSQESGSRPWATRPAVVKKSWTQSRGEQEQVEILWHFYVCLSVHLTVKTFRE